MLPRVSRRPAADGGMCALPHNGTGTPGILGSGGAVLTHARSGTGTSDTGSEGAEVPSSQ